MFVIKRDVFIMACVFSMCSGHGLNLAFPCGTPHNEYKKIHTVIPGDATGLVYTMPANGCIKTQSFKNPGYFTCVHTTMHVYFYYTVGTKKLES